MSTSPADFNAQIIEEFRANEGRVGGMIDGMPLLLLHHTPWRWRRSERCTRIDRALAGRRSWSHVLILRLEIRMTKFEASNQ